MFWLGLLSLVSFGLSVGLIVALRGDELDRESPQERCESAECIAASCTVVTSTLTPVYKCGKNSALHCRDMQLVLDAAEKDGSAELGVASYESATPACKEGKEENTIESVCGIYSQVPEGSTHPCWIHPTETDEAGLRRVMFFSTLTSENADAIAADPPWLIVIICLGAFFGMGALLLLVIFTLITNLHCCGGKEVHSDDYKIAMYFGAPDPFAQEP